MPKLTGGQALARALYEEGVRVIFGLPGVQLYHAMDGLYEVPDIRFITTRHEQATTYMADGYARAGGGIGTALVVPGPGLQNASAGIGTAYSASSPILVVAGQVQKELIGVERGVLHEVHDQMDTIRPVTKWSQRILDAKDVPGAVHEAFYQLKTGRPRPVEIEIPPETLEEEDEVEILEPVNARRAVADADSVRTAADAIAASANPVFWVGGGAVSSGASATLLALAEHLQAPVVATSEGKGAISDRHYLSMGGLQIRNDPFQSKLQESDLVIAVGTRLATPQFLTGQRVLQIDIDEEEIGRNYENTLGVVGDARLTLEAIHSLVCRQDAATGRAGEAEMEAVREERRESLAKMEPQASYVQAIRDAIPDDGIFVSGMTQIGYYSRVYYPVYEPGTYITSSYYGNLGFAWPTALGAKVACPDKAVVAVSGDGGFLFNSQELATAVQHNINAVVVVFNDNAFGNVLRDQQTRFEGRDIGAKLHNPDFRAAGGGLRRAAGCAWTGRTNCGRRWARRWRPNDAPTLIEVPVGMMPSPFG